MSHMTRAWRSLRVQLAVLGFLAIYLPVLLLFGVTRVTEHETIETPDGVEVTTDTSTRRSPWATWTAVALGPAAAGLAWWWAGRAVRPIDRVRAVAEDIEASDLSRRIGLDQGPAEMMSLAASFDTMLDRLEAAADTQRRLIEETSHELRTPLSVLAANADVLLADPHPTIETYRRGLERSRAAAARLQATIEDLLVDARGRARTLDRQPADLVEIVRGVVDDAGVPAAAKHITVSVTGLPSAVCAIDEPTVRRAVSNLVDNAIRYAPDGSGVDVDIRLTDSEATVVVTDHGPGIPHHEQDHIFQRFWRGQPDARRHRPRPADRQTDRRGPRRRPHRPITGAHGRREHVHPHPAPLAEEQVRPRQPAPALRGSAKPTRRWRRTRQGCLTALVGRHDTPVTIGWDSAGRQLSPGSCRRRRASVRALPPAPISAAAIATSGSRVAPVRASPRRPPRPPPLPPLPPPGPGSVGATATTDRTDGPRRAGPLSTQSSGSVRPARPRRARRGPAPPRPRSRRRRPRRPRRTPCRARGRR